MLLCLTWLPHVPSTQLRLAVFVSARRVVVLVFLHTIASLTCSMSVCCIGEGVVLRGISIGHSHSGVIGKSETLRIVFGGDCTSFAQLLICTQYRRERLVILEKN